MIRTRREELLEIPPDEPETLHAILSKLPKPLDLEKLISETIDIFTLYPPERLPFRVWRGIPSTSVLKTTRKTSDVTKQSLDEGQVWFNRQAVIMARNQRIAETVRLFRRYAWRNRRSIAIVGLTLGVGLISWLMRKHM